MTILTLCDPMNCKM